MESPGIQVIQGDLFSAPAHFSLAHCVSRDLKMGKGIATLFKQRFGRVPELRSQNRSIGQCAYLVLPGKCIFYLITKEKYYELPIYEALKSSLEDMEKTCRELNITHIAMPKIGCGLDRLSWNIVHEILSSTFPSSTYTIQIYIL
jgi:O-acetyl-ADP-ribose deacetylase (regulator of RNase III)